MQVRADARLRVVRGEQVADDRDRGCSRVDHVGLSVSNLDYWVAKLRAGGVKFLEQPYKLGDARAVMVEGPSREAIELVEVK